jgi:hypothetical protein
MLPTPHTKRETRAGKKQLKAELNSVSPEHHTRCAEDLRVLLHPRTLREDMVFEGGMVRFASIVGSAIPASLPLMQISLVGFIRTIV